jgi:hypothetical protein
MVLVLAVKLDEGYALVEWIFSDETRGEEAGCKGGEGGKGWTHVGTT